jgi:hypothetical protein
MINFNNYPEIDDFKIPSKDLYDVGYPISDFKEAFFEEKRKKYIFELDKIIDELLLYIQMSISAYSSQEDINLKLEYKIYYEKALKLLRYISGNKPSEIFFEGTPKNDSGNCLGTDKAYYLYKYASEIGSKVQTLYTYEEYYVDVFKKVVVVINKLFNGYKTRGQFYGYLDHLVNDFIVLCRGIILRLKGVSYDWKLLIKEVYNNTTNYYTAFDTLERKSIRGARYMRSIIEPIIKFYNLVEMGDTLVNNCWAAYGYNEKITNVMDIHSKNTVSFSEDYIIKNQSSSFQITKQMLHHLTKGNSNFELLISKSIKITLEDMNLRHLLEQNYGEIISP